MIRRILIWALGCIMPLTLVAQQTQPADTVKHSDTVKHWKFSGQNSFALSQVSYTAWSDGGDNAFAFNAFSNLEAKYTKKDLTWNNFLWLAYGTQYIASNAKYQKINDRLEFQSDLGLKAFKHWDYAIRFNFKSQFAKGYNYKANDYENYISRFMAPGSFLLAVGMTWKPVDYFSMNISPLGGNLTLVVDTVFPAIGGNRFGVPVGSKELWEMVGSVNLLFKKDVFKNVNLASRFDARSNYLEDPQNIVFEWETLMIMKVNKFISCNAGVILKYNDKTNYKDPDGVVHGPRLQIKELLSIGFVYTFSK